MKEQKFGPLVLPAVCAAGGAVGFPVRLLMLRLGYDAGGTLISGHWTYVLLWVLTAAVLGVTGFLAYGMGRRETWADNYAPSNICAGGLALGALLLFLGAFVGLLQERPVVDRLVSGLGIGGAGALFYHGYLRSQGKGSTLCLLVGTVYAALELVIRFKSWSVDPLLGDYCFRLLACVLSMLGLYQLSCFPVDKGSRPMALFCAYGCVYLSIVTMADGDLSRVLYSGGMALVMLFGAPTTEKPAKPRRKLGEGRVQA